MMKATERIQATIALGRMRTALFQALEERHYTNLESMLPRYAHLLENLLRLATADPTSQLRLHDDHVRFFDQLTSALSTSRIQIRLELERFAVSRSYMAEMKSGLG